MDSYIRYIQKEFVEGEEQWDVKELQLLYHLLRFFRNDITYRDKTYTNHDIHRLAISYLENTNIIKFDTKNNVYKHS